MDVSGDEAARLGDDRAYLDEVALSDDGHGRGAYMLPDGDDDLAWQRQRLRGDGCGELVFGRVYASETKGT